MVDDLLFARPSPVQATGVERQPCPFPGHLARFVEPMSVSASLYVLLLLYIVSPFPIVRWQGCVFAPEEE